MHKPDTLQKGVQELRQVYINGPTATASTATASDVVLIETHMDDTTGKEFVLWGDILMAFKHTLHVRHGSKVLAYLKGPDYKPLDPPRIGAVTDVILDVYVEADPRVIEEAPVTTATNNSRGPQLSSTTDAPQPGQFYIDEYTESAIKDIQVSIDDKNKLHAAVATYKASHNEYQFNDKHHSSIDYEGVFDWFLEAASQGDVSAQCKLGMFYDYGLGVKQDYTKAKGWYLKAADQGYAEALSSVGNMYFLGLGVKQDYSKAIEWFLKAANQGDPGAQSKVVHLCKHWQ
ncbi:MAG: hypothetical protein J3R72DRAFT_490806 [Linnemannia gamsii]|nr:MAG: hypothetical protein J3R72DRAFT_490806 [Linnemannia gamsii]